MKKSIANKSENLVRWGYRTNFALQCVSSERSWKVMNCSLCRLQKGNSPNEWKSLYPYTYWVNCWLFIARVSFGCPFCILSDGTLPTQRQDACSCKIWISPSSWRSFAFASCTAAFNTFPHIKKLFSLVSVCHILSHFAFSVSSHIFCFVGRLKHVPDRMS